MDRRKGSRLASLAPIVISVAALIISIWALHETQKQTGIAAQVLNITQANALLLECDFADRHNPKSDSVIAPEIDAIFLVKRPDQTVIGGKSKDNSSTSKDNSSLSSLPPRDRRLYAPLPVKVAVIEIHSVVCALSNRGNQTLMEIVSMTPGNLENGMEEKVGEVEIIFKVPALPPNESRTIRFTNDSESAVRWRFPETVQVKTALNSKYSIEAPLLVHYKRVVTGGTPEEEREIEREAYLPAAKYKFVFPRPRSRK